MSRASTTASLVADFVSLGLQQDTIVMVHSSLSRIGWTQGGPATVIAALLEALGPGTLVMPAESPQLADPLSEAVFDPLTTMGAIPETFRGYPGTLRSPHPLGSICANGRVAREITAQHALELYDRLRRGLFPGSAHMPLKRC